MKLTRSYTWMARLGLLALAFLIVAAVGFRGVELLVVRDLRNVSSGAVGRLIGSGIAVVLATGIAWFVLVRLIRQLSRVTVQVESIIGEAHDAFIGMDVTGCITQWNAAAEQTFGWPREQAVGRRLSETIIPPHLRDAHEQGLVRFHRTGTGRVINTTVEMPALHRNGHEFPVELTIWSVGEGIDRSFYAFVRDISERIRAEEALSESRARRDALLRGLAEGVITVDTEGKISSVNRAMEEMFGWREEEVRGRLYSDAYPAFDSRAVAIPPERRLVTRAFELKQPVTTEGYDMSFATRDGRHVPVAVTAAPMVDEDGEVLGAVEIVRNMSRESEVDRLKSALVSTVSHELRTPLTMIQGFSELLLTRSFTQEQVRNAAQHIHTSAERLGRLIENLLSVSRIDSGRLTADIEPLELRSLVFEAVHPFAEQWRREIQLDMPEGIGAVMADHDKLIQILTNLLSNAIKYSPDGTPVELKACQSDGRVEIAVTDHGIGMTEEELERVFDKFFRANRSDVQDVGGTGLGLYITKALIEMHGGEIEVTSRPSEGTTFRFWLRPAIEKAHPAKQKEEMSWQNS